MFEFCTASRRAHENPGRSYLKALHAHVPEPPGRDPDQTPEIPPPMPPDEDIDLPPREDPAPIRDPEKPAVPK